MKSNSPTRLVLLIVVVLAIGSSLFWQINALNKAEDPTDETTPSYYSFKEPNFDGIGKVYMGREISNMIAGHGAIKWLERNDREQTEKPDIVIRELKLKPDTVVADIGAGSGYFTFRIAPLIPQGKIYAVEIGTEMLEFLDNKKTELGARNVIVHAGTPLSTQLPRTSIDVAFMVDSYHEFSHPREMINSIIPALKKGGRVVFIEYRGEDPKIPIKPLHKMTVEQLTKEMNAVGLKKIAVNYDLPVQHITTFEKP